MLRLLFPIALLSWLTACDPTAAAGKDSGPNTTSPTGKCDEDGDGALCAEDCDDNNPLVHPTADELCNGIDDNCDTTIDEGVTETFYADADGDGFGNPLVESEACEAGAGTVQNSNDCDDGNVAIYPGNTEVCDSIDNNCDGAVDEGVSSTWYADADGDAYGDSGTGLTACEQPSGYVVDDTDCDDSSARAYPGNAEACDALDNNCNGVVDEGVTTTYWADVDGDGYGNAALTVPACAVPAGYALNPDDCDDAVATVNPAGVEVCNGVDDNCDGAVDESSTDAVAWYRDSDGDGFGNAATSVVSCSGPPGFVADSTDCDDRLDTTYPGGTELCNGVDDDCNGSIDDAAVDAVYYYLDADRDGYGNSATFVVDCTAPTGYVADFSDCNDLATAAYPGATELCDGTDNDCDGAIDEDSSADAGAWYADIDGDSFGDAGSALAQCEQPAGYVGNSSDCDDTRAESKPGGIELCNTYDDDCDGTADEDAALDVATWYLDSDGDAYGTSAVTDLDCSQPSGFVADSSDCNDAEIAVNPGATEVCNSVDDDCDGSTDEADAVGAPTWYRDADVDAYGDVTYPTVACTAPSGYVSDATDCDDLDNSANPGAVEVCDGTDDDCNGVIDDNPITGTVYYVDADGDGFGDPGTSVESCSVPPGYADNAYDCNDGNLTEPVVVDATTGSTSGDGSLNNPFLLMQDAVDNAFECVVAYPGTYNGAVDLDGKSIDIWGVEGAERTIIDGQQTECTYVNPSECGATLTIASGSGATSHLHGFTITGGTGYGVSSTSSTTCADSSASHNGRDTCTVETWMYKGGGVYINGDDPTFEDVHIRGNTLPEFVQEDVAGGSFAQIWLYSYGGGAAIQNSAATFDGVWVYDNFADQGGGLWAGAGAAMTFEHGYLASNEASDGAGIAVDNGGATFVNAVVFCNEAAVDGGGAFVDDSGSINLTNTAFYRNTSSEVGTARGSEAYVGSSGSFYLYNSIVESGTTVYSLYGAGLGLLEYNNVYNAGGSTYGGSLVAGVGSISSGGNFTSVTCDGNLNNDDFSLVSGSASRNAGNPGAGHNDTDGTYNDMGAYGGPGGGW